MATSTRLPADQGDAHADKKVVVVLWGESCSGGEESTDKQTPPTGLLWRHDRLKARLDAMEDVADLTKFSLIVLSYL